MPKTLPKKFIVGSKNSEVSSPAPVLSQNFCDLRDKLAAHKAAAQNSLDDKLLRLSDPKAKSAHLKLLTSGVLATAALIGPFNLPQLPDPKNILPRLAASATPTAPRTVSAEGLQSLLQTGLKELLPKESYLLSLQKQKAVSNWVSQVYGIRATTSLEGHSLPSEYGLIGAEQHLLRYPGDTTEAHMRDSDDWGMYYASGTAPLTGAWGYFASSKDRLTPELAQKERYYAVVQTFLLPDWNRNWTNLKEWYKFRKVIIVNTVTYQACIADIADSGPSVWTGKVFGGSPEVMEAVGLANGPRKGPVVILFVDDPENKIPLGPIPYAEANKYV